MDNDRQLKRAIMLFTACTALSIATGCDANPQCESGEIRYRGNPPWLLCGNSENCFVDDFSVPCSESDCGEERLVADGYGWLWGFKGYAETTQSITPDRMISIIDNSSLKDGNKLVFEFGFIDETGEQAPEGWGFISQGAETSYLSNQLEGTAKFMIKTAIAKDLNDDEFINLTMDQGEVAAANSQVIIGHPGRLDIEEIDDNHIKGRFFISYDSLLGQQQAEINGCFNLNVGTLNDADKLKRKLN